MAKRKVAKKKVKSRPAVKKAASVRWKPPRTQSVMPNLSVKNCAGALEWWAKVFGVKETAPRAPAPDGVSIWHAEFRFDDTIVYCNDAGPESPAGGAQLFVYVPDIDSVFERAIQHGARQTLPVTDMFWGDRSGQLVDPFGVVWSLATKTEWLSHQQIQKRAEKFMAEMQGQASER